MYKSLLTAITAVALVLSLCACKKSKQWQTKNQEKKEYEEYEYQEYENAVYHWKNHMNITGAEQAFLKEHDIRRVYVRFFDVVSDHRYGAVPSAVVHLNKGGLPKGVRIVPTVFITLEALMDMDGKEEELAANIYQHICEQLEAHKIRDVDEIQIDCDWTKSTQSSFFALCESLCKKAHEKRRKVSSTIRLHQLSQPAPPVDKGVLMVYNVGDLQNVNETNSILRADIVKKYLSKAPEYPLQLDAAYPIFSWGVVFRNNTFNRLTRLKAPADSVEWLKPLHGNIYEVTSEDATTGDYQEKLRYEYVTPETLNEVKGVVEKYLGGRPHRIILYHLDETTISKYKSNEISAIYE